MKNLFWKWKIARLKRKYPKAGHWELNCLALGFTKAEIDEWERDARMNGIAENVREDYCKVVAERFRY